MGEVRIHGDDVRGMGILKTGDQRTSVSAFRLRNDPGAEDTGGLRGSIYRAAVYDDDLGGNVELADCFVQFRQQDLQVGPLVPGGDDKSIVGPPLARDFARFVVAAYLR